MYEDLWGAQEARESETFLARNADVIVVVNEHICTDGVIIVPPAFRNLFELRIQDTERISREKNAENRDAISNAFEKMVLNLNEYKKAAKSYSKIASSLDTQQMADKYIKIMVEMK